MDIADRLQELLGVLKLNPNQFAKEMGYERPEKDLWHPEQKIQTQL
jgi:hypothetical protein